MIPSILSIPDDVVDNHILCHIRDIVTRVRFGAVCRSWRAMYKRAPLLTPPAYVYLINDCNFGAMHGEQCTAGREPSLFDPISATIQPLPRPSETISDDRIAGFHNPYMAYSPHRDHPTNVNSDNPIYWPERPSLLYNPFSGRTLAKLPTTIRCPDGGRETLRRPLHIVNFSSLDPSTGSPRLVAAIQCLASRVLISQMPPHGHDGALDEEVEWVASEDIDNNRNLMIDDLIFFKDELYCISSDGGRVFAMDLHRHLHPNGLISSPTPRLVYTHGMNELPVPNIMLHFVTYGLVELGGEMLSITEYSTPNEGVKPKVVFEVHKVDLEKGTLVPVNNLPDSMLFVGEGCTVSWLGPEPDHPFFKRNHIYFFDVYKPWKYDDSDSDADEETRYYYRIGKFPVGGHHRAAEFLPDPLLTAYHPAWININV